MKALRAVLRRYFPRSLGIHRLRRSASDCVLLTFDDGPHQTTTGQVLDRLRLHGAKAIFFVVGNRIARAPSMLKEIVSEGHWLGNHTFTHPLDRRMGYQEYLDDLNHCQQAVFDEAQYYPKYHRPPCGQKTAASLLAPKRLGLVTLFWSVSAEDWRFRSDAPAVERGQDLAREVQPGDVLLFHDERSHMLLTLDVLLPALRERGINLSPAEGDIS